MKNTYQVKWSKSALNRLNNIYNYLEKEWTINEIISFTKKLENRIDIISDVPYSFPKFEDNLLIRKSVLTKHISIFYKIEEEDNLIYIVTIFDNRQNPNELKQLI